MENKSNKQIKKTKLMLTVLISTITAFIIAALVNYFESKPHGIKGGQWFVIFMVSVYGLGIGAFVAYQVPQKYEVSERNVYYILEDSIYIQPSPNEITFFTEGDYGEPIPMNFKVDTVSIKHTNDKISQIEVIKYVGFNKFSLEDPKVTVNILMSSNPHQWCGFLLKNKIHWI